MNNPVETVTLVDRLIAAVLSVAAAYGTVIVAALADIGAIKGDYSNRGAELFLGQGGLFWLANGFALIAGLIGFAVGSKKMAEFWGWVWNTNKPKAAFFKIVVAFSVLKPLAAPAPG